MLQHPLIDLLFALLQEEEENRERLFTDMSMASHELKTPLTVLKVCLQQARRQLAQGTAGQEGGRSRIDGLLASAERQVDRLTLLVGDLCGLSEQRSGSSPLHTQPCDLCVTVRLAVEVAARLAPERPIHLALPEEPVILAVDPPRIEQVIVNLLSNALKYSAEPLPIRVGLEERGDEVTVSVRDEGPGLTPLAQARIWEAFYRAPESADQVGPSAGLGLGLAICQLILERHRGQIGVTSTRGDGATFWFTLSRSALAQLTAQDAPLSTAASEAH